MNRYLVTGGAGFIGSHVVDRLVSQGHQVRVLDDFSSGKPENLATVRSKIECLTADIRDRQAVARACQGVDYVIHEAAWRSVPKSMTDPWGYTEVNVLGTVNLLEACVKAKVRRAVCVSSSSVYGQTTLIPMREEHPTAPVSPYATSKLAMELYGRLFAQSLGLETVSVRYFNVFGPRQSLENQYAVVIPKFICCLLRRESPPVDGDGTQSRDFTYVDNVAEATILATQAPGASGEVLNIALGEEHSLLKMLEILSRILGYTVSPTFHPQRPGDVRRTLSDPSKARRLLKWTGSVGFEEGLRRTVEWFRAHPPA